MKRGQGSFVKTHSPPFPPPVYVARAIARPRPCCVLQPPPSLFQPSVSQTSNDEGVWLLGLLIFAHLDHAVSCSLAVSKSLFANKGLGDFDH
jgi:hypothetical protein